jgi:phosphatidate cytidylyltransferase
VTGRSARQGAASNLQVRILSAVILAAIAIIATWLGGLPFRALVALGGVLVFWEWQSITGYDKYGVLELAAPGAMVASAFLVMAEFSPLQSLIPAAFAMFFAIAAAVRRSVPLWFPAGVPYALFPVLGLAALRADNASGLWAIVFLFAIVWATDIFAYFGGRTFGGPKLAPNISPGKTWSGAISGAAAGTVGGLVVAVLNGSDALVFLAMLALLLSLASQGGDLFESFVKRRFGVKDSGTILPGHGGIMDRVDGLIGATVALYLICVMAGYGTNPAAFLFP